MQQRPYLATWLTALIAGINVAAAGAAVADDVAPGAVITAANLDSLKDKTFEGHRIGDMIPERMEWQIRDHNLRIELAKTYAKFLDPRIPEATKRYAKDVKLDPSTLNITGYKAGRPFPTIDPSDPMVGVKIIWNFTYGFPQNNAGILYAPEFVYTLIDGERGIERIQHWGYKRYFFINRLNNMDNPVIGDGSIFSKTLLYAYYPQDIKGLGTFSIRYTAPKVDDVWAYVRTVRRVRRLSGGAWMDPIGGTDQLQDDLGIFNAHPSWYQAYNLLGRRTVLAVVDSPWPGWRPEAASLEEQFPMLDLSAKPYWNPKGKSSPVEVFVLEGITPPEHPYSKKIVYIDTETYQPYLAEAYDRKGDFWKWAHFPSKEQPDQQNPHVKYQITSAGVWIDFQRRHATFFHVPASFQFNPPGVTEEEFSLATLEQIGR